MAQSQDGRDTVQEWVHKQKKETKKRKGKKTKEKELGLGLPVTVVRDWCRRCECRHGVSRALKANSCYPRAPIGVGARDS